MAVILKDPNLPNSETNPYLVSSYDDMKLAVSGSDGTKNIFVRGKQVYGELTVDLDMNKDKPLDFEWETMQFNNSVTNNTSYYFTLDLKGHTIQNIMLKKNNKLFQSNNGGRLTLKNGAIRNVFSSEAVSFFDGQVLTNISFSGNGDSLTDVAFNNVRVSGCSIYYQALNDVTKRIFSTESGHPVRNSDIYLDLKQCTSSIAICGGTSSNTIFDGCRLRGNAAWNSSSFGNILTGVCTSCVVDMTLTKSGDGYGFCEGGSTGVINNSKCFGGSWDHNTTSNHLTPCTDSEIRTYANLIDKGFAVMKVG